MNYYAVASQSQENNHSIIITQFLNVLFFKIGVLKYSEAGSIGIRKGAIVTGTMITLQVNILNIVRDK